MGFPRNFDIICISDYQLGVYALFIEDAKGKRLSIKLHRLDGGTGVLISGAGMVDDNAYVTAVAVYLSNAELLRKCKYNISDFSDVTDVRVTVDGIERVVELCKHLSGDYPKAILAQVGKQDIIYGLQRMWETYADDLPWDVETFRDRITAEAWIKKRVAERYGSHVTIQFALSGTPLYESNQPSD